MDKMNWKKLCDTLGWHLITPETMDVEHFIREVAASESVISEAMHGAILADVLRVPWKRLRFYSHQFEGEKVSEFKWMDWLFSIEIYTNQYLQVQHKRKKWYRTFLKFYYKKKYYDDALKQFRQHDSVPFYLSDTSRFDAIVTQLKSKKKALIDYLKQ
jgi:succinoglycan biosynthesis protein ExoV